MPRRPTIEEILREEMFALEQQQELEKNPESMANNPDGLSGGVMTDSQLLTKDPMTQWGMRYNDQPTDEAMYLAEQQRGNAVGREFRPRVGEFRQGFMELPSTGTENPTGMRGLAGAYNSLPEKDNSMVVDPTMKVMPQVPQQDMQQLMDFYMNGGSDV